MLVAGPSGSGKTVLATQFIREGVASRRTGRHCRLRKAPERVRTDQRHRDLTGCSASGQVGIIHTRPLDLSIDETLHELTEAIQRLKARRVVIDSLSGFELALAPTFREDFRESLYRLVAALTGMGVTVMMTAELEDSYIDLRFSPHGTAFLTDAIILQRYVEIGGRLAARDGGREGPRECPQKDLRLFEITADGIVIGEPLDEPRRDC